jgi:hypothetical protein
LQQQQVQKQQHVQQQALQRMQMQQQLLQQAASRPGHGSSSACAALAPGFFAFDRAGCGCACAPLLPPPAAHVNTAWAAAPYCHIPGCACGSGPGLQQQQQQQQADCAGHADLIPLEPRMPRPPAAQLLHTLSGVLKATSPTTPALAEHMYRGLLALPQQQQARCPAEAHASAILLCLLRHSEAHVLAALVWLAAKLEENRRGTLPARGYAAALGLAPTRLPVLELLVMTALQWSPYRGWLP